MGQENFITWATSAPGIKEAREHSRRERCLSQGWAAVGQVVFSSLTESTSSLKCSMFKLCRGNVFFCLSLFFASSCFEVACESCILSFVVGLGWPRTYWLGVGVLSVN